MNLPNKTTPRELRKVIKTTISSVSPNPDLETTSIMQYVFKDISSIDLLTLPSIALSPDQQKLLETILKHRKEEHPIEYLIGNVEFAGCHITVTSEVLIPRPETERLVEIVCDIVLPKLNKPVRIIEVGVGSGCITTPIIKHLATLKQQYSYVGVDVSEEACEITKRNVIDNLKKEPFNLRLENKTILEIENLNPTLIISNPPYLTAKEYEELDRSVAGYEPKLALVGGTDGLKVYRQIKEYVDKQSRKPEIMLEISPSIAEHVMDLFSNQYQGKLVVLDDQYARERYLYGGELFKEISQSLKTFI